MRIDEHSNLEYFFDNDNFKSIQDILSSSSNLPVIIVDYQGYPITQGSGFSEYCSIIRTNNILKELCRKCDARGGLEATRLGKPYIYICHMGLIDFAMPIEISGKNFGTIIAGQVVLKDVDKKINLEKITESSSIPIDIEFQRKLREVYDLLPIMTFDSVQTIATTTFKIANLIINGLIERKTVTEKGDGSLLSGPNRGNDETPYIQIKIPECNSPILRNALDYISEHFEKKISLDEMATLCNISSSYFSKLFNKIVGMSFSNYINLVRIERACNILINTNISVTAIALDVGFEDSSYFNQVFKNLTGMTPTYYRAINRTRSADVL